MTLTLWDNTVLSPMEPEVSLWVCPHDLVQALRSQWESCTGDIGPFSGTMVGATQWPCVPVVPGFDHPLRQSCWFAPWYRESSL